MASEDEPQDSGKKLNFFSRLLGRGKPAEPVESSGSEPTPDRSETPGEALPDLPDGAAQPAEDAAVGTAISEVEPPGESNAEAEPPPVSEEPKKRSWWSRLRAGLSRSSSSLGQGLTDLFAKRKLDEETLDDLEDVLLRADLGVAAATRIRDAVAAKRYEKGVGAAEVREILAREIERALEPVAAPLVIDAAKKPFVVLVVGVNGSGKTTTIGKLAAKFAAQGLTVVLAAGDTFRAAAIEQLQIWGAPVGAQVFARAQGSEPASLAYDALKHAKSSGTDVLIVDTAGRLQNRKELMAELQKIGTVVKKLDPEAPHAVLLVLDATIGQNALSQVEIFTRVAGVTGLVMTKLDGTARGGILVAVADRFGLPVHYIGVGETVDDLEPFAAADFARAIAGLEETPR